MLYRSIDENKIWNQNVKLQRAAVTTPPAASANTPSSSPSASFFWDELIKIASLKYQSIIQGPVRWKDWLATARAIRSWYEDAVYNAMLQFSEHPIRPITELEVFIGNILSKKGVQNSRQRDHSIKLRDEYQRICEWIVKLMRSQGSSGGNKMGKRVLSDEEQTVMTPASGYELDEHESLHLCMACVHVGCEDLAETADKKNKNKKNKNKNKNKGNGGEEKNKAASRVESMQSFKLVAASALLAELSAYGVISNAELKGKDENGSGSRNGNGNGAG